MRDAVTRLGLDLRGKVILTEAATGWFSLTPIIAAIAGAEEVVCLSRETRYGTVADATAAVNAAGHGLGVLERISIVTDRDEPLLFESDIVTNLGMVRPLDRPFLSKLKPTAVIPLMWETWEFRREDINLRAATECGIPVLGTNEHHPAIDIFPYVGQIAVKLLHEIEIEIHRSNVLIIGCGEFAEIVRKVLLGNGAYARVVNSADLISGHAHVRSNELCSVDAIILVDNVSRLPLVGNECALRPADIVAANPSLTLIQIAGGVEAESVWAAGLQHWPTHIAKATHMSVATEYVGPRPLIDLHAAGLRIGQEMCLWRSRGLDARKIMADLPREFPLAMGFSTQMETSDNANNESSN